MISHKIVKEFEGYFDVNSIPSKGSIFTFTIPLYNQEEIENEENNDNESNNINECNSNQLVY